MEREQAIQYTKDVQIKVLKERIDSHEQLCRDFLKANPTASEVQTWNALVAIW
jgi:hypothetical protein